MKKILVTLILTLLTPLASVDAGSCSTVTAQTYDACCTNVQAGDPNAYACFNYTGGTQYQDDTPTTQSTDGSGTQSAPAPAPVPHSEQLPWTLEGGAGPSSVPINTAGDSAASSTAFSPTSGSSQLAQCSNIKFLSLLDILIWIKCIIVVAIIPLIFALALVVFLWGVFRFIAASDPVKKQEGKKFIMAGLIGLFVMTSIWGIINILGTTLGVQSTVPALQTKSSSLPLPKTP